MNSANTESAKSAQKNIDQSQLEEFKSDFLGSVLSAEVVPASGQLVTASENENSMKEHKHLLVAFT